MENRLLKKISFNTLLSINIHNSRQQTAHYVAKTEAKNFWEG